MISMVKDSRPGGGPKPKRSKTNKENLPHVNSGEQYRRAKDRATAGPLASGTRMPDPEVQLRNVHHPGKIVVEDTNLRVIKKRAD